jgi:hypothetical protein
MSKNFEIAAKSIYPDLNNIITRKQVNDVVAKTGVSYPTHITNKQNTIKRGVFHFNANLVNDGIFNVIDQEPEVLETDEEMETRIAERYETMETLIGAVANNTVNSLVINGGAGLGKSHTVNKVLNRINSGDANYVFHRGYLKNTGLFRLLWDNREAGQTIVIDDCDKIFGDEDSLNMLKSALELRQKRLVCWGSEKVFVDEEGEVIPRYFDYEGSIIFLSNLDFSGMANGTNKNAPHIQALESRSLVLDLKIRTKREYMTKIKMTVRDGMLREKGLTAHDEQIVMDFLTENVDNLKELSLRMCEKVAALYMMDKKGWEKLARSVCLV